MPDRSGSGGFCTECGAEVSGSFCPVCGAPQHASVGDHPMRADAGSAPDPPMEQPRKRTWLMVVAVLVVAVVAFGVGYGLSRRSADAPVAAPTGPDTTVTSAGTSDIPDTTIPEPVEPVRPVTSATTLTAFPYPGAVLSPDGRLIFYEKREDQRTEESTVRKCVQDIETFAESCVVVPRDGFYSPNAPVWAQASNRVVWGQSDNRDVFVYDVSTNTVSNLTDDGIDAEGTENIGKGLTDLVPTWISGDEEIAFFRSYSQESLFRWDLYSVDLDGNETALAESPMYERTVQGDVRLHPRWSPSSMPPLPIGNREVLVAGNGAIFSVDLDSGTTTVMADYADQYEEEIYRVSEQAPLFGLQVVPRLWPIAQFEDGRVLLFDPLIFETLNQWGQLANAASGNYVLDTVSGSLTPLFQAPNDEYGGPWSVALSPDSSELLVMWFDATLSHPYWSAVDIEGGYVVSVIDVDGIEGPIDPRELPIIYGSATDPALSPWFDLRRGREWAANDTVLLSTISDEGRGSVLIELNRG